MNGTTLARCECCGAQLTMGDADTLCAPCEDRVVWRRPSRGLLARFFSRLFRSTRRARRTVAQ